MSRCNIIRADGQAPPEHRFPFHITVAGNTGIRRPARKIFLHKIIHDSALEFFLEIHYIMRNIQLAGHSSGILHCTETTAPSVLLLYFPLLILPDLHGDADHIISLFFQKIRRYGRIHAAGHTYYYFFL
jgi:hypothetical protein